MTASAVAKLTDLLTRARCLLLDFDGPICSVFAGRPSRSIVIDLLRVLPADNVPMSLRIADTSDPLEVLRYAATVDTQLAEHIEQQLRAAEIDATRSATPTPHARDVIDEWRRDGRLAAIVSNNSSAAITAYLAAHTIQLDLVMGRTSPDPTLLKPSPHLINETMRALDDEPDAYILVGDSVSDIIAARRAGIRSIGYANAHGKHRILSDAGADVIIDDMATLSRAAVASA